MVGDCITIFNGFSNFSLKTVYFTGGNFLVSFEIWNKVDLFNKILFFA